MDLRSISIIGSIFFIISIKIKCDQYWPDEGVEYYGNIQVTHLHTICLAFYTKRIFTIKIKNAKKVE